MSGSAILGTVIGLAFLFALTALLCSAVTEVIANLTQMRARYLITGLRAMLDAPESTVGGNSSRSAKDALHRETLGGSQAAEAAERVRAVALAAEKTTTPAANLDQGRSDLALALFDHPLVRSLQTRRVAVLRRGRDGGMRNPPYIAPDVFALALIDTLLPRSLDAAAPSAPAPAKKSVLDQVRTTVSALPRDYPARRSLLALIDQAEGDLARFQRSLEGRYDEQMRRIAGWYKRWAKVVLGVTGLVIAVLANIDTVSAAHSLYVDEPVRRAVVAAASDATVCQNLPLPKDRARCASAEIAQLDVAGLPMGFTPGCDLFGRDALRCWTGPRTAGAGIGLADVGLKLLGFGLTGVAVSFGAPFWFDALSRLGSLRTTGPKPA